MAKTPLLFVHFRFIFIYFSYENALMSGLQLAIHKYHIFSVIIGFIFFIMYGTYALSFWYGSHLIAENGLPPGNLFTVRSIALKNFRF